jgi:hypothetical protein
MKQPIYLLIAFILTGTTLFSQNSTPDTLVKKSQPVPLDTVVKQRPAPQKTDNQPKTKSARKDTRPLKDRIDLDLNTSFWMNTSQVFGEVSLLVSYRFPKILSIGTGPTYIFNYQRGAKENLNGWGGKIFARAQLLKFFYLWTEYQGIDNQHLEKNETGAYVKKYEYVDSWFLGAGVNIRFGRRMGLNLSVLYDVLYESKYSPYYSPVVYRVGFSF